MQGAKYAFKHLLLVPSFRSEDYLARNITYIIPHFYGAGILASRKTWKYKIQVPDTLMPGVTTVCLAYCVHHMCAYTYYFPRKFLCNFHFIFKRMMTEFIIIVIIK